MSHPARLAAALLLTLGLVLLFVVPVDRLPDVDRGAIPVPLELTIHVAAFALLTVVWLWALPRVAPWKVLCALVLLAAATEGAQALPFVERSAKLVEFGYNVVGVGVGVGIVRFRDSVIA